MLHVQQANPQLVGALGSWWDPTSWDWGDVWDTITDGAGKFVDGVEWLKEQGCDALTHDKLQRVVTAAQAYPDARVQASAMGLRQFAMACGMTPTKPGAGLPELPDLDTGKGGSGLPSPLPSGSIAARDPKLQAYRVAVPPGANLSGLGELAEFVEVGTSKTLPEGARIVPISKFNEETGGAKAWYKRPLVWAGIGGGVLVLGGFVFLIAR